MIYRADGLELNFNPTMTANGRFMFAPDGLREIGRPETGYAASRTKASGFFPRKDRY